MWRRLVAVAYGVGCALIFNELGVTLAFDIFYKDIHTPDPDVAFDIAASDRTRLMEGLDDIGFTLKHLAAQLAEGHQLSKKQSEAVLGDLVTAITKHLKKGARIRLNGLGILVVRKRGPRMGRNPATGEVDIALTERNHGIERHDGDPVYLDIEVLEGDRVIATQSRSELRGRLKVPGAKAWSPESPTLYGLRITAKRDGKIIDAAKSYFAFRTIKLGKDAKGPVLVIEGLAGNITGKKRADGFANRLKEVAPGLEIVASLPGDWDRGKAANITNDILTKHPDLVAIFAANDGMALGAVETVFAASKGDKVVIVGVDGNSDAVKSIKAGRLTASVAQLPYLVDKQAVENVKKVADGGKVEETIYVPTLVLTKDVIEAGKEPMLEFVK